MQSSKCYYQIILNSMTFSHNQLLYLSCATTPPRMGLFPTFHRLTSNNYTLSTKSWVRGPLLSSCQSLMVETNPFTQLNKFLWVQEPSWLYGYQRSHIIPSYMYTHTYNISSHDQTYLHSSCEYIIS